MSDTETITAVSTPPGEGGIGIIRLSGPESLAIARRVFTAPCPDEEARVRYLYYGRLIDPADNTRVDDGFMVYMRAPRSFTGEDVVEFHLHGGTLVLKKTLEVLLRTGARPAGPGEFTRRAFLNGRLDLARAEAVIDVIRAQTESALSSARGRLDGSLSRRVNEIKEMLLSLLVSTEAGLDFPEEEVEEVPHEDFTGGLEEAAALLKKLLRTHDEGRVLREGVKVLILGRPNVGKSSLLNILLKEERAIVTPVPGTTRDVIEETVSLRGIPARLMDTAGLRETADFVESLGVRAARERISEAGLILFVVDSSAGGFTEDLGLLAPAAGKKVIIVANKDDLGGEKGRSAVTKAFGGHGGRRVVFISALKEEGIEGLEDAIYEESTGRPYGVRAEAEPGELVVSVRHKRLIEEALEGVDRTRSALANGMGREFAAADLRYSVDRPGEITGEVTTEDLLDRIFGEFCIGK